MGCKVGEKEIKTVREYGWWRERNYPREGWKMEKREYKKEREEKAKKDAHGQKMAC